MRKVSLIVCAVLMLSVCLLQKVYAENISSLDGRAYTITMKLQGGGDSTLTDELSFQDRLLKSRYFATFGDALTVLNNNKNAAMLTAETRQTKFGKIKWIAAVKGNTIEGTVISYKDKAQPLVYVFKGQRNKQ